MGFLYYILIFSVIGILIALFNIYSDKQEEKNEGLRNIERIKKGVTAEFDTLCEYANTYGNEYCQSLIEFATKMDKLCDPRVSADLKPYDIYNVKKLMIDKTHVPPIESIFLGRIVIDKNLVPKFMLTAPSLIPSYRDIELEVALISDGVRELAEKCRKIKMDSDIEKYRKDRVKEAINGK